mmetsp:Transcript_16699/g.47613  ORF Transcript_16699/g.47613 Transcript_16699/m.47613 type:complete len:258 (+) Transcript_16699:145-918(+)
MQEAHEPVLLHADALVRGSVRYEQVKDELQNEGPAEAYRGLREHDVQRQRRVGLHIEACEQHDQAEHDETYREEGDLPPESVGRADLGRGLPPHVPKVGRGPLSTRLGTEESSGGHLPPSARCALGALGGADDLRRLERGHGVLLDRLPLLLLFEQDLIVRDDDALDVQAQQVPRSCHQDQGDDAPAGRVVDGDREGGRGEDDEDADEGQHQAALVLLVGAGWVGAEHANEGVLVGQVERVVKGQLPRPVAAMPEEV